MLAPTVAICTATTGDYGDSWYFVESMIQLLFLMGLCGVLALTESCGAAMANVVMMVELASAVTCDRDPSVRDCIFFFFLLFFLSLFILALVVPL